MFRAGEPPNIAHSVRFASGGIGAADGTATTGASANSTTARNRRVMEGDSGSEVGVSQDTQTRPGLTLLSPTANAGEHQTGLDPHTSHAPPAANRLTRGTSR